jgi:hypothetical protein
MGDYKTPNFLYDKLWKNYVLYLGKTANNQDVDDGDDLDHNNVKADYVNSDNDIDRNDKIEDISDANVGKNNSDQFFVYLHADLTAQKPITK